MSEKGTYDVFVSYSSKNKNVADAIVADFEQHGIRCWYAPRDIMPGTSWVSAITDALRMVKVQVLIYTDESNASRQVMNEVALAFNEGKTIVPFRLSETRMSDEFEYYLSRVHWLDAVTKNLADNITQLRNYVEVILSGVEKAFVAGSPQSGKKRGSVHVITLITAAILLVSLLSLTAYLIFRDSGSEVQPNEPDAYITPESQTNESDAYVGAGNPAQKVAAGDGTNTSSGESISSEDNANSSLGGDATSGANASGASSGDITAQDGANVSSGENVTSGDSANASLNGDAHTGLNANGATDGGASSSGNSNTGSDGPASGSSSNNTHAGTASSGNNTATDGDNIGSGSNTPASGDVAKDIYDMTVDELETAAVKGDVAACELLGSMYYNGDKVDQNYGKARMYLERAVENNSTSAKVFKTLGDIYYYGKDVDESDEEAGRYYKKAIEMGVSNYDTLANYGMILYRDDRFEESAGYFEKSVELEPDPTTMYNAGLAYYGAGDTENAVKWLQKAIDNGFTRAKDAQKLIETIKG
ncbi:MAG: TIR domain-containing protein [Lachnospiraceae bacterium]|nr:TIR domain-containing protein [Lachnospiraceae bacterium]